MARDSRARARQVLVWVHVVVSVGWLATAATLGVLAVGGVGGSTAAGLAAAHTVDVVLVQDLATSAAFTGMMLSALTSWGYTRYWWVTVKLVLTLAQIAVAIAYLSTQFEGEPGGARIAVLASASVMVSLMAFQAWLSVAKPWGLLPGRQPLRTATPAWAFLTAAALPAVDVTLRHVVGFRGPVLMILTAVAVPIVLPILRRRARPSPPAGRRRAPGHVARRADVRP